MLKGPKTIQKFHIKRYFRYSSKKVRLILYLLVLLSVLGISAYDNIHVSNIKKYGFSLNNYLENPDRHGNRTDERFGRIVNISTDYFYFDTGGTTIKIYGPGVRKAVYGETALLLSYGKDGKISMIQYHNYNYNYFLYAVSVLAVIVFIIMFFKEWKMTLRGFKSKNA